MSEVFFVDNVTKVYDTGDAQLTVLDGIDLQLKRGKFVAITGPSGSGKTTLLNLMGLIDVPTSGHIYLNGEDVAQLSRRERTRRRRRSIGFVFQDCHLHDSLTARQNVEVPAMFSDERPPEDRSVRLLERVGLGDRTDHYPSELSGGQQQRVAIARALMNDPAVILADEPSGNLDEETSKRIFNELTELRALGKTVLTVTHDPLVSKYVDREVSLRNGQFATGSGIDWSLDPLEG